jgi:hypothetical protein
MRRLGLIVAAVSLCIFFILDLHWFLPATLFPDQERFLSSAANLARTGMFAVGTNRAWEMPGTAIFFSSFIARRMRTPRSCRSGSPKPCCFCFRPC